VSRIAPSLATLAVDVVSKTFENQRKEGISSDQIRVLCAEGGSITDSKIFLGFAVPCVEVTTEQAIKKPAKALLLQFSLDRPHTAESYRIVIPSAEQIDRLIREEENYIKDLVIKIKKSGANVVLVQQDVLGTSVSSDTKKRFTRKDIKSGQHLACKSIYSGLCS
jgi:T-complex protein 1 subunit delta